MVNHYDVRRRSANHVRHGTQLDPGTCIQHHDHVTGIDGRPGSRAQHLDLLPRIQKRQPLGNRIRIDNLHLFAGPAQQAGHGQFAAQRIAVGAHVAGQNEAILLLNQLSQRRPIEGILLLFHIHPGPTVSWWTANDWPLLGLLRRPVPVAA